MIYSLGNKLSLSRRVDQYYRSGKKIDLSRPIASSQTSGSSEEFPTNTKNVKTAIVFPKLTNKSQVSKQLLQIPLTQRYLVYTVTRTPTRRLRNGFKRTISPSVKNNRLPFLLNLSFDYDDD